MAEIRAQHNGCKILFGADRLDYTKGLRRRVLAVERLLERSPEAARKLRVLTQRPLHPRRVARLEGARRMPRQEGFDLVALRRIVLHRHHGQPRSTPEFFNSSESFFRA